MWLLFLPVVWWAGAITACAIKPDTNLLQILQVLTEKLDQPFSISYTPYTLRCVFTFTIAYVLGIGIYYSQKKNYRRGVEHGSAKWGDAASICKRYRDKRYTQNLILTQNFRMGLDCYKHKRNLNVLVVGGSGAGKSRAYAVVNIMQCNCSMVVTDPKGELLRKTGGLLEREGYEVRVFDLINPETSFCYNPFAYVRDDKDVLKLINNLIRNTTPKGAQSSDPFWEKSETALLQALMLYLLHEAPPEEQNFSMIMEMLGSAQVKEDDEEYQSPLDILFERLEMRNPESIAVKQYQFMKEGSLIVMEGTVLDMTDVYEDLDNHIIECGYDVRCFGYDPYNAKEFVERWASENGPFGIEKVIQGAKTESVPLGELKKLSEERMLLFDEDLMTFAMGNCITLEDTNGNRKLLKKRYEQKIDAVAAMMDAYIAFKANREAFE